LIDHGQDTIEETSEIAIHCPQSVVPARVVPTQDALDRMRHRVGYQLREYVSEHFRLIDTRTKNENQQEEKDKKYIHNSGVNTNMKWEAWLQWPVASEADLVAYADTIDEWEKEMKSVYKFASSNADALENAKVKVKAAAYRYRNLTDATLRYDDWTMAAQQKNILEAEVRNRETRAQFVYSVTMACALFYRITGVLLTNVHIIDNVENAFPPGYDTMDPSEQAIINDEPPKTDIVDEKERTSYQDAVKAKSSISRVRTVHSNWTNHTFLTISALCPCGCV
jgi:hypothetical protein